MKSYNFILGYKHIHFVGVGGISMSALAKLCLHNGVTISGSDKTKTEITTELEHLGAKIYYKHNKKNILGADLVVFTTAVGQDNPEVQFAKNCGIPVLERADFLGKVAQNYQNVIAVAGSHGKTTTCGMIGSIFKVAGLNPTMFVGGQTTSGNLILGDKQYLIVEACEYKEHFLKLSPNVAAIMNIDYDHPDYFKTEAEYSLAFQKFAKKAKDMVFIDEKYSIFVPNATTFGSFGKYSAQHIKHFEDKIKFDVYKCGNFFVSIVLNTIGRYNILNALCAISVADFYNIDKKYIAIGLKKFVGIKRRYEYMGKLGNNVVITDYAHHPTQIKNCILATKEVYSNPITVVFEPHTYSRTKAFLNQFADALSMADSVILLPTYSAREKTIRGATSKNLFNTIQKKMDAVKYVRSYKKCLEQLKLLNSNIILILGAGSVINLALKIKQDFLSSKTLNASQIQIGNKNIKKTRKSDKSKNTK